MEHLSLTLLILGISGICLAVAFHLLKKRFAILTLMLAGLLLGSSAITRDNFLHPWDERFHAVVALNAMDDPLEPKLFKEKVYGRAAHAGWIDAHIWLHKPPLFTWQMAMAMTLFGKSVYAMRISSLLMYMLLALSVYAFSRAYYPRSAFWTAMISFCTPTFLLLISGRMGMEHNDIAFVSWISVSISAFLLYQQKLQNKYLLILSLAAAFAILTKWLAGSLVFFVWGLYLILSGRANIRQWKWLFGSALLTTILVLPWQLYIFQQWPELASREWEYNSLHLFEVVEGHDYPWWLHLKMWWDKFRLMALLFLGAIALLIFQPPHRKMLWTFVLCTLAVMLFYSLAKTRMPSYTLLLFPILMFLGAFVIHTFLKSNFRALMGVIVLIICFRALYLQYYQHSENPQFVLHQKKLKEESLKLKNAGLKEKAVIFNTPQMEFIEVMFYTERVAYESVPSIEEAAELKEEGYEVVIWQWPGDSLEVELHQYARIVEIP